MVNQVESGTVLVIKGRTFKLVWTDETEGFNPCHHCALYKEFCVPRRGVTFVDLCTDMQKESNTYFIEESNDIQVHGINNQEITISALSALRDAERKIGNHSRAKIAQRLIDQIG